MPPQAIGPPQSRQLVPVELHAPLPQLVTVGEAHCPLPEQLAELLIDPPVQLGVRQTVVEDA